MLHSNLSGKYAQENCHLVVLAFLLEAANIIFHVTSTFLFVLVVLVFFRQDATNWIGAIGAPPILDNLPFLWGGIYGNKLLFITSVILLVSIILENATESLALVVYNHLSSSIAQSMRMSFTQSLLKANLEFLNRLHSKSLEKRSCQDIEIEANLIPVTIQLYMTFLKVCIYIVILLSFTFFLTSLYFLIFIVTFIYYLYEGKINRAIDIRNKLKDSRSKSFNWQIQDIYLNIKSVKLASNKQFEYQRVREVVDKSTQGSKSWFTNTIFDVFAQKYFIISIIFGCYLLGIHFLSSKFSLIASRQVIFLYLVIAGRLMPLFIKLEQAWRERGTIGSIMDLFIDKEFIMPSGTINYSRMTEGIRFEGVSFSYPSIKNHLVLKQINLWIPKGTTLALVGIDASGKSTLVNLIPRFYDPVEGRITIDGKDLRDYDLSSLRRSIGLVDEKTCVLFSDSVRNNIAYGCENVTESEIIEVAQRVNLYDVITQLPRGLDTMVGERGCLLSPKQELLLLIARNLLRDPDIVILEESILWRLDTVAARSVNQAIDELCRDRTKIVITGIRSIGKKVDQVDQIALMDRGRIVEVYTYQELLKNSLFRALLD